MVQNVYEILPIFSIITEKGRKIKNKEEHAKESGSKQEGKIISIL